MVSLLKILKLLKLKIMNNNNEQYNPLDISWDQYGNPIIDGGETTMGRNNNNPGTSINMDDLRSCISLYLNDIESYGRVGEHEEAINVLNDFVEYIDSMNGRDATPIIEKQWLDNGQAMNDYNEMEEEWDMDNYNEMQ